MKTKKPLWVGLLAFCLSTGLAPWQSFAAESSVRVTLPEFGVKLNGNQVDNQYRQYPLLVYKDITYFPMTWYDSRLLGLQTDWSLQDGLTIAKDKVASSYVPYTTGNKNGTNMKATIPAIDITINNKKVNNATESYPLLSYNDIIYFPLTWRFAHDEFGWQYNWNNSTGLSIQSDNTQLKTVQLPDYAGDNDVAIYKGYYYYVETAGLTNEVYRAPVEDTTHKELVYTYELDTSKGINKNLKFQIKDNELWFSYHNGGAIMGSDVYCKVNEDGKAMQVHRGYFDVKSTAEGNLIINLSVPPNGNNLIWVPNGEEVANGKSLGNPNLIYGWHISNGSAYSGDHSTTIIGDDIFVLASSYAINMENLKDNLNQIYRINMKTNETKKIVNAEVSHFKIIHNKLFYVKDEDQFLYSSNLDGTGEQKLSHNQVGNWYEEIDGNVYYTNHDANGQIHLYKVEKTQIDTLLLEDALESVQSMNDQIICKIAAGGDYSLKILDKSGKLQLSVTDQVSRMFAYDNHIVFVSATDQSIKQVE
ncbi:DUF5050 domain-containing protein [Paenibacillus sp. RC67]|uniref:DUF5050 domain-containing protein n=1 Tax=Paenibacillus sp. RC67 TaxID=3039392 RepID=UPI0024AD8689|nr:DUF5050 domain-containing protein [Paenibacillus sp. RC67]